VYAYTAFVGRPDYVAYRTAKLFLYGLALLTPLVFLAVKLLVQWIARLRAKQ
jgi:hypothetical protein